jgi:hypothetical protein
MKTQCLTNLTQEPTHTKKQNLTCGQGKDTVFLALTFNKAFRVLYMPTGSHAFWALALVKMRCKNKKSDLFWLQKPLFKKLLQYAGDFFRTLWKCLCTQQV